MSKQISTVAIAIIGMGVVAGSILINMGRKAILNKRAKEHPAPIHQEPQEQPVKAVEGRVVSEEEMLLARLFNNKFSSKETTVVDFDPAWANGTGYYDHATQAALPEIEPGGWFCAIDCDSNRWLIGKKLTHGKNVVIFERFGRRINTDGNFNPFVVVANLPDGVKVKGFYGEIKREDLERFFNR